MRVFPLPVGALTRTCAPAEMRGQVSVWISVGLPYRRENQSSTTGWNTPAIYLCLYEVFLDIVETCLQGLERVILHPVGILFYNEPLAS